MRGSELREQARRLWEAAAQVIGTISAEVPALAFYLLAALAPLALGLGALSAIVFADALEPTRVSSELAGILPPQLRDDVATLAGRVREQSLQLLVLSVAAMIWSCGGALGVIARTMTRLAGVEGYPWLWARLRLLGIGALFALLVVAVSALGTLAGGLLPRPVWLALPLNTLVVAALLMLIYRWASPLRPPLRRLALGAAPAAMLLQAAPLLAGAYLEISAQRLSPTGIFFALAALLASCAIIAAGLLTGAALAAGWKVPEQGGAGPAG